MERSSEGKVLDTSVVRILPEKLLVILMLGVLSQEPQLALDHATSKPDCYIPNAKPAEPASREVIRKAAAAQKAEAKGDGGGGGGHGGGSGRRLSLTLDSTQTEFLANQVSYTAELKKQNELFACSEKTKGLKILIDMAKADWEAEEDPKEKAALKAKLVLRKKNLELHIENFQMIDVAVKAQGLERSHKSRACF